MKLFRGKTMYDHVSALLPDVRGRVMSASVVVDYEEGGRRRPHACAVVVCGDAVLIGTLGRPGCLEFAADDITGIQVIAGPPFGGTLVLVLHDSSVHRLTVTRDSRSTHTTAQEVADLLERVRSANLTRPAAHHPPADIATAPTTALPHPLPRYTLGTEMRREVFSNAWAPMEGAPAAAAVPAPAPPTRRTARRLLVPLMPLRKPADLPAASGAAWPQDVPEAVELAFWDNYVNQVSGFRGTVSCQEGHALQLHEAYLADFPVKVKVCAEGCQPERFLCCTAFYTVLCSTARAAPVDQQHAECVHVATNAGPIVTLPRHRWDHLVETWHRDHRLKRSVYVASADIQTSNEAA